MGCRYIAYLRVSTAKQGDSGLGLEAQRKSVEDYAKRHGCEIIATFTETESGRKTNRTQLQAAIDMAGITGAQLLIARLDRLTRSVAFLCKLRDERVDFIAVDMPQANKLTVNVLASVAEYEAERIADNTSKALAAAKARGVRLGNPMGEKAFGRSYIDGSVKGASQTKANADAYASKLAATVASIKAEGITTLQGIADALNGKRVQTSRKGQWRPGSVALLLKRLDRAANRAAA